MPLKNPIWEVCPPPPSGNISVHDPPGKELINRTDDLTAAGRKAQEVGSTTSQWQIENLPVINPNDRTNPDPATSASPEIRRVQLLDHVQLDTGRVREEAPEVVGSRFSPGAVTNYACHLWYVVIRIQQQGVEALEYSEEGDLSRTSLSQPLPFSLRVNPNPSLIPHT